VAVVGTTWDADWDWLKWLPHHQHPHLVDALGPSRMTYRSLEEAITGCRPLAEGGSPHVVIIVDDGLTQGIEQPFSDGPRLQLRLDGDMSPDSLTPLQASLCARRLAPYRPVPSEAAGHTRTAVGWLDLMGLDDPAAIDPARQWSTRRAGRPLRVAIGVS